jgi:hypothetical protein
VFRRDAAGGQVWPSCFKIGPYAPLEHPQDLLRVSPQEDLADTSDAARELSWLRAAINHPAQVHESSYLAQGDDAQPDDGAAVELTAIASDGSNVLRRSGSFATVQWKGVPWLSRPFEYWVRLTLLPCPPSPRPFRHENPFDSWHGALVDRRLARG